MGRISMPQGKGSQLHNRREYDKIGKEFPDNIDQSRSHLNVTLIDRDIREVYDEIFGEALKEYNDKQKRADRKIDNYYDHIAKSKNGEKLFYEDVLQWGSKSDFENNPEMRERACEALKAYVNLFEKRNPNLKLIGAYIHMDEASPHLHLDYIPIAHGYSRGLSTRNSLDRAMKEMGFQPEKESRKNNATKLWKENEREVFNKICIWHDLEVEAPRKARGSLSVEEYKEARDKMLGSIQQEKEQLKGEIALQKSELATNSEALDQQAHELESKKSAIKEMDAITSLIGSKNREPIKLESFIIPEKKSFLGRIEEPERKGVFIQDMQPKEIKALMDRVKVDEGLERAFNDVQERCNQIYKQAHADAKEIRAEASAERNETVAKAQEIINNQQSIIQRAQEWAKNLEKRYKELLDKVKSLFSQKEALEHEVAQIEAYKDQIEPLRVEYDSLSNAVDIMSGKLDNEITQAKFRDWDTMPYNSSYDSYRREGKLLALYNNGTIRQVGSNENGGWDNKTLDDKQRGLCRVGIMQDEERVSVPKSLVKELIATRDRSKDISSNLENFIDQQTKVNEVVRHRGRDR